MWIWFHTCQNTSSFFCIKTFQKMGACCCREWWRNNVAQTWESCWGSEAHDQHNRVIYSCSYAKTCKFNVNADLDVNTGVLVFRWEVLWSYQHFSHAIKMLWLFKACMFVSLQTAVISDGLIYSSNQNKTTWADLCSLYVRQTFFLLSSMKMRTFTIQNEALWINQHLMHS